MKQITISVSPLVQPSLQPRADVLALTPASSLANDLLGKFDFENNFPKIFFLPGTNRKHFGIKLPKIRLSQTKNSDKYSFTITIIYYCSFYFYKITLIE